MIKTHLHLSTCVQSFGENKHIYTGPDSLVVRASASGAVGRRFVLVHAKPKAIKMVLVDSLLTLASKG